MKKIFFLFTIILTLNSCGTYRSVNMNRLYMGMSKKEVRQLFGSPDRVLYAGWIDNGYEEVLQYTTNYGEIYALTFFNDYLESYGFLDRAVSYENLVRPPYYRPLYPPARPINKNPNKPGNTSRPPATGSGSNSSSTVRQGNSGATNPGRSNSGSTTTPSRSTSGSSGNNSSSGRSTSESSGATTTRSGSGSTTTRSTQTDGSGTNNTRSNTNNDNSSTRNTR